MKAIDRALNALGIGSVIFAVVALAVGAMRSCRLDAAQQDPAYQAGIAEAERRAAEAGGWDAWTHRSVNQWCREHGWPDAYPGEAL